MAVDTRSKRASATQVLTPWFLAPVLPDGTLDQGDRQHIAWCYSGILLDIDIISRDVTLPTKTFGLSLLERPFDLSLLIRTFELRLPS